MVRDAFKDVSSDRPTTRTCKLGEAVRAISMVVSLAIDTKERNDHTETADQSSHYDISHDFICFQSMED